MKATPERIQQGMIEAYLSGMTLKEAAATFDLCEGACLRALRRHGIQARDRADSRRRYAVNQDFFHHVDTEEKAYWLGFVTADGGIVRNSLVLIVQDRDAEHLARFRSALGAAHPVQRFSDRGRGYARLTIYSKRLVQALASLGVLPKKSFSIAPCVQVPGGLARHYWRGLVDGDGWLTRTRKGHWIVGLSGNAAILEGFRQFLSQYVRSKATVRPHRSIFQISFGGTYLPRIVADVLYSGSRVSLHRKRRLVSAMKREPIKTRPNRASRS